MPASLKLITNIYTLWILVRIQINKICAMIFCEPMHRFALHFINIVGTGDAGNV